MSRLTVNFIKCAILYFIFSMLLGLHMSAGGPQYPFLQIHTHFNLLGWMSMMIYGVGYHILPRFSGKPLFSERLATAHIWFANIGLLGMALGWILQSTPVHLLFSVVEGLSMLFFAINMFKTIRAIDPPKPKPATATPAAKK
jgi:cytochrome c oxidase cbb3-type subunit 1